ncbi:MAG TPA: CbiX/SirB N-terminal domain-containing protein [Bryobacteraceae bacterium]|nr:CbiX/SirB N-terminal domain-containing protein [Bryobacteraceae bacterium]
MSGTGYIVFAHGSSIESANEAVRAVANDMAAHGGFELVRAAFLEGGRPDLRGAVDELAALGVARVIVVPYFLTLGLHLQRDLPRLIESVTRMHPNLVVEVTAPLDGHPGMVDALVDRARESACERG